MSLSKWKIARGADIFFPLRRLQCAVGWLTRSSVAQNKSSSSSSASMRTQTADSRVKGNEATNPKGVSFVPTILATSLAKKKFCFSLFSAVIIIIIVFATPPTDYFLRFSTTRWRHHRNSLHTRPTSLTCYHHCATAASSSSSSLSFYHSPLDEWRGKHQKAGIIQDLVYQWPIQLRAPPHYHFLQVNFPF